MSFVICCATSKYGIIAGDGRVVDYDTNEVVREDFQKVRKINDRLIVGFAGDPELCVSALGEMSKKYNTGNISVDKAVNFLHAFLQFESSIGNDLICTTFYVLGVDKDLGRVRYTTVSADHANIIKTFQHMPLSGDDLHISYCGCDVSKDTYDSIRSSVQDYGYCHGLRQEIRKVAATQPTVGQEVYIQEIWK